MPGLMLPNHMLPNGAQPNAPVTIAAPFNDVQLLVLAAAALPSQLTPAAAVERAALLMAEAIAYTQTMNLGDLVQGAVRRRKLHETVR